MSRLVIVAIAACLLAPGDVTAKRRKGRKGKVVRVERVSANARKQPRVLQVASQSQLISYGWKPEVGAELIMVDTQGIAGRAVVTQVTERQGTCQSGMYDVEYEMDDWVVPFNYSMQAVSDYDMSDDARRIHTGYAAPSGNPNEYVWTAIDGDGDGVEDMLVTHYQCADTESPGASIGSMATAPSCMDTHLRKTVDSPWERVTHDVWYQCH